MSKSDKIIVEPYNCNWPNIFQSQAQLIKDALAKNLLEVHHIGSTAVPGLLAKPKIDIIAVVADPLAACTELERIGFEYRGEYNVPLKHCLVKRGDVSLNLHVFEQNHPEIELNLIFRDYLRAHPEVRDYYANLKQKLLEEETAHQKEVGQILRNYTLGKADFIRSVLKQACFNRLRMVKCNDRTEWEAARELANKYFLDSMNLNDNQPWDFNRGPNYAHLILYQGVDVVGYANIEFNSGSMATINFTAIDHQKCSKEAEAQFFLWIGKWLKTLQS